MVFKTPKPPLLQFSFNCPGLKREKPVVINNTVELYTEHLKTGLKTEIL